MTLQDGVTGNTSGFELEDEGSTPSPAANLLNATEGTSIHYIGRNFYLEVTKMELAEALILRADCRKNSLR